MVYIADSGNKRVRKVRDGAIFTVPHPNDVRLPWLLQLPTGLALNRANHLLVADGYSTSIINGPIAYSTSDIAVPGRDVMSAPNGETFFGEGDQVWRAALDGTVTTYAGIHDPGGYGDGGPALLARFGIPSALATDTAGIWYIADASEHRVRGVASDGTVTTIAGTGAAGMDIDGEPATASRLRTPRGLAVGTKGELYISDTGNHRVAVMGADRRLATFAGTGVAGNAGLKEPATAAQLNAPEQLAVGPGGDLYIADTGNNRIVRVKGNGTLTLVAGDGTPGFAGDGDTAVSAHLYKPRGLALDASGKVYIADTGNGRVRRVSPAGVIETLNMPSGIELIEPCAVAVAYDGYLLVSDCSLNTIVRLLPEAQGWRIAGTGAAGFSGDGGEALEARFNIPVAILPLPDNSVLVADSGNGRVRMLTPDGTAPLPPEPVLTAAIVNSASFSEGPVAPGEMVSVFVSASEGEQTSDEPGWQVRFDGKSAFQFGETKQQVNVQAPFSLAGQSTTHVEILRDQAKLLEYDLPVDDCAPGLFVVPDNPVQAIAVHEDGSLNSTTNPAYRGQFVVLYATGLGLTDPPQADGVAASAPFGVPVRRVSVAIGGMPAEVLWAGLAPSFIGLYQINVRVPQGYYSAGDHEVVLTVGDVPAQSGVKLAIR